MCAWRPIRPQQYLCGRWAELARLEGFYVFSLMPGTITKTHYRYLAAEGDALPNAVWIPLSLKAADDVREIIRMGRLRPAQELEGLPNPSGANAERIACFLGRKEKANLFVKTDPVSLDNVRARLIAQVGAL